MRAALWSAVEAVILYVVAAVSGFAVGVAVVRDAPTLPVVEHHPDDRLFLFRDCERGTLNVLGPFTDGYRDIMVCVPPDTDSAAGLLFTGHVTLYPHELAEAREPL